MKKLILPLLLLVAIGMLSAVESAPSEVVGYVKYDCLAGNNLIALPMDAGLTTSTELADAYPGMMTAISYWDATIQGWVTASDLGGFWDLDLPVDTESVLMVYAPAPFALLSIGDMPAANAAFDLVIGNTTVFVPLNKSAITDSDLLGADMTIASSLSYWDAAVQGWVTASDLGGFWDITFPVSIGYPVMAYCWDAATWPAGPRSNTISPRNSK
jgi:hypothetical protein